MEMTCEGCSNAVRKVLSKLGSKTFPGSSVRCHSFLLSPYITVTTIQNSLISPGLNCSFSLLMPTITGLATNEICVNSCGGEGAATSERDIL
ncbi:unnamed protein product [Dracunculus medinensis]|uniref:HMA domain-containing protein n=1 Tax=Dracunculus medinensis TaxID=318479 RepID=A0A0N4U2F1_DRAME|nr:unnamed protein product [Dracunculus medinensis]